MSADATSELRRAVSTGDLATVERLMASGQTSAQMRLEGIVSACEYVAPIGRAIVARLFAGYPAAPGAPGAPPIAAADLRPAGARYLRVACSNGHLALAEQLFETGITVEDARSERNTALKWACEGGHAAVVERLFEAGLTARDAQEAMERFNDPDRCAFASDGCHACFAALIARGATPQAHMLGALAEWEERDERAGPAMRAVLERWAGTAELEAARAQLGQVAARAAARAAAWEATQARHDPSGALGGLRFAD
jgi:hypothetical protein